MIAEEKVLPVEDTEIKEVRGQSTNELIGKGAPERLIEGNHEDTKSQSFSWCLCVFVVQIPGLSRPNDALCSDVLSLAPSEFLGVA